jgi:hypothetical protein
VIEQVGVNPRWGGFGGISSAVYPHGNCIELERDARGSYPLMWTAVAEDGPGRALFAELEQIHPEARDMRIRGQVVPISTDDNYYWSRTIEVERLTHEQVDQMIANVRKYVRPAELAEEKAKGMEKDLRPRVGRFELRTWQLMRGLVPEHRELLLASEEERRRGLPKDLPLLLTLDDWEHPRLLDDEMPSSSDSFKEIAKALAAQDAAVYQGGEEGNVHWRHWPESGSL